MEDFFKFITAVSLVILIVGLVKPELVIRWGEKKDKKEVLKYYGSTFLIIAIIGAALAPAKFSITKNVEDITTKESITISGTAPNNGNLTVNGQRCEITKEKFNCTYPLSLGMNEFKTDFNKGTANTKSQVYSIKRMTEEDYKKEKVALEEAEKQLRLAGERESQIKSQFDPWDGSHSKLERYIKNAMNDPSSYKHEKTVYWDMKDHLVVCTTFRGKNAFGAIVLNSVKASVSMNGDVLKILSQN